MEDKDLKTIDESPHLLNLLIGVEDVLDALDTYVFRNWLDAEVVKGPKVRRYWIDVTLQWASDAMPDPRAAKRMLKNGILIVFDRPAQAGAADAVWQARVSVPRRLIDERASQALDLYDDTVDVDEVQAATDAGLTVDSPVMDADKGEPAPGDAGPPGSAAPAPEAAR